MPKNLAFLLDTRGRVVAMIAGSLIVGLAVVAWLVIQSSRPRIVYDQLQVGDSARSFRVAIPSRSDERRVPLVIAFHGAMSNAEQMARASQLDRIVVTEELIVVYPDAMRGLWGVPGVASTEKIDADLAFFDTMIDRLDQQYQIDRQRIYVVGMSQGASFALHLAAVRSETIAAVAAHSHAPPPSVWEESAVTSVPIMLVVGDQDRQASTEAVIRAADEYREQGHVAELVVIPDFGHRWDVRQNGPIAEFLESHSIP